MTFPWTLLEKEGGTLFHRGGLPYIAYRVRRKLECPQGAEGWNQLDDFVRSASSIVLGWISYEMGAWADPQRPLPAHASELPGVVLYEYENIEPLRAPLPIEIEEPLPLLGRSDTLASYTEKIHRIQEEIAQGNTYQVNLSQSFTFGHHSSFLSLFLRAYRRNPAAYSFYLHGGAWGVGSLSPELLIERQGQRVRARPIKGTAPRHTDPHEDFQQGQNLFRSSKNQSELLMITDLMRNDLRRISVAQPYTESLCDVEAHRDVFHLVSTISATSTASPIEILRAVFPAGSITGCPKRSTQYIIHHIEGRPRGVYTGSLGWIEPSGDFCWNVAIRTLTLTPATLSLSLGGAILYESSPEDEFLETLYKGRSFFEAFGYSSAAAKIADSNYSITV